MPLNDDDPGAEGNLTDAEYWAAVDELAGGPCSPFPPEQVDAAVARLDASNG